MVIKHGSPLIILGAFLAIAIGSLAYLFGESLLAALGAAVIVLMIFAYLCNRATLGIARYDETPIRFSGFVHSALFYITVGALTEVWSGIWYWYLSNHPPEHAGVWYTCTGLLLTGLVLVVLGVFIGPIGRAARETELPPEEVTAEVIADEQRMSARV